MLYEKEENGYLFSNAKHRLQPTLIHRYLSTESYWAQNIPYETVAAAIAGSDCYGIYCGNEQVGFGRVITDGATFGYLADVFVLPLHRGKGLSKVLMRFILDYPAYSKFRRLTLATRDAHGLYEQFGFTALAEPARMMELKLRENYTV